MPRGVRNPKLRYDKLIGLEDERNIMLSAMRAAKPKAVDFSGEIPGASVEKAVYNYLLRLGVEFQYEYNWLNNRMTGYNESSYKPDFIIPALQNTVIEVYETWFHSSPQDNADDKLKWAYASVLGYTIIYNGIPTPPSSNNVTGAKYVVWTENEIRGGISALITRDLPELMSVATGNAPAPYLGDRTREMDRLIRLEKTRLSRQMRPAGPTVTKRPGPRLARKPGSNNVVPINQNIWNIPAQNKEV